ncbi:MAG: Phosphatidylserine decarboxylase proenzyme [Candidatus Anoxychlamydiales bacterium]|uniref:phosphatidylserine decarboxylase n=1 Tax=marine sediment metagenome TaxID=412755 RepID=A0A0F9IYP3_9ZZZZ|nr:Phosphatidylserine decarboxylase proenzyme [Candidatus Anoxychlamydiales bacterium]NGX40226.1 Phosphatidylserine decarboxylase proenzyme [Candidatus Anoxychlamydiales bacterium]HEU64128.1 phosphatidylserine decarboxylase [Chlamydiota bacterium]
MDKRYLFDREKKKKIVEKVYFKTALEFLYSNNILSKFLLFFFTKFSFLSKFYGYLNSKKTSMYKIKPFIKHFNIDEGEFEKNRKDFKSFNDFFIRKLKPDARKIDQDENTLVFPSDGRFLAFSKISDLDNFSIKNHKFNLNEFLKDEKLAEKYLDGAMLLCRLAPDDYHRFHFPVDGTPTDTKLINGYLYSVNPIALRKNIKILSENKRMLTILKTQKFSDILYIEIGATNVGTINQTFFPNTEYKKGEEKGYFSLGASSIVLLFEKNQIKFDDDLLKMSKDNIETKAKVGSSFAKKI